MALTPALAQSPGHAQRHRQVTVPESSGLAPVALRVWLLYPGAKHLQSHPTVSGWAEGWLEFSSQLVVPVGCDPHPSARAAVVQGGAERGAVPLPQFFSLLLGALGQLPFLGRSRRGFSEKGLEWSQNE